MPNIIESSKNYAISIKKIFTFVNILNLRFPGLTGGLFCKLRFSGRIFCMFCISTNSIEFLLWWNILWALTTLSLPSFKNRFSLLILSDSSYCKIRFFIASSSKHTPFHSRHTWLTLNRSLSDKYDRIILGTWNLFSNRRKSILSKPQ